MNLIIRLEDGDKVVGSISEISAPLEMEIDAFYERYVKPAMEQVFREWDEYVSKPA